MKTVQKILLGSILGAVASYASAGVSYDKKGNQGFSTAKECNQAIANGTAKFYNSHTRKKPKLRRGESSVKVTTLGRISPKYARGACDLGTGKRGGRDGVARAIQGKYVPYSPNMKVNAYFDASGNLVRVSMQRCDNWFSGNFPEPFYIAPKPQPKPKPRPVAIVKPKPIPVAPVIPAVQAAKGSTSIAPIVAGIAGIAAIAALADDGDSGTTGSTGTN